MTATADTKPRTLASAWRSPAATYYLLAASAGILLIVGLASVLSSSSIESLRKTGAIPTPCSSCSSPHSPLAS